tara:strand:+ start:349 stop:567 length:219 start_codon:yes stop_codon:yes gene_type:complete
MFIDGELAGDERVELRAELLERLRVRPTFTAALLNALRFKPILGDELLGDALGPMTGDSGGMDASMTSSTPW